MTIVQSSALEVSDLDEHIEEKWLPVANHLNYEVSDCGKVRNIKTQRIIKPALSQDGYIQFRLPSDFGRKTSGSHRLVALAFLPNPENKPQVNHLDGFKTNNTVKNLEWCTSRENLLHAFKTGLQSNTGSKHSQAKLKESDIPVIRKLIKDGVRLVEIGKMFGVGKHNISNIKTNKIWRHVK